MTFELRLSREAEQDLEQVYIYLFELSPEGADRLFPALMSAMTEIGEAPRRWAYTSG
jgi:plasmid stabilization system protein ParE